MFKAILATGDFTPWALFSLLVFFSVFVGVIIWVYRKGSKEQYDEAAQLPLDSDHHDSNHAHQSH